MVRTNEPAQTAGAALARLRTAVRDMHDALRPLQRGSDRWSRNAIAACASLAEAIERPVGAQRAPVIIAAATRLVEQVHGAPSLPIDERTVAAARRETARLATRVVAWLRAAGATDRDVPASILLPWIPRREHALVRQGALSTVASLRTSSGRVRVVRRALAHYELAASGTAGDVAGPQPELVVLVGEAAADLAGALSSRPQPWEDVTPSQVRSASAPVIALGPEPAMLAEALLPFAGTDTVVAAVALHRSCHAVGTADACPLLPELERLGLPQGVRRVAVCCSGALSPDVALVLRVPAAARLGLLEGHERTAVVDPAESAARVLRACARGALAGSPVTDGHARNVVAAAVADLARAASEQPRVAAGLAALRTAARDGATAFGRRIAIALLSLPDELHPLAVAAVDGSATREQLVEPAMAALHWCPDAQATVARAVCAGILDAGELGSARSAAVRVALAQRNLRLLVLVSGATRSGPDRVASALRDVLPAVVIRVHGMR
jgi:hypothetical protein